MWNLTDAVTPDELRLAVATARPDAVAFGLPHHEVEDVSAVATLAADVGLTSMLDLLGERAPT